ncbi:hypothetical protein HQ394_19150 (plasmid) [Defluviicoccus vanus]|uniref:Uncharacterized protein n=1 Tax=Defluviicoccus vanus TaxID=111831 RepID=A0A7H1N6X1_9PROT|nr:hypothetical protein HQ394_19150 [Defluviicoccus vanus]
MPAAFGGEPLATGCRRRPIDPWRQVERRAVTPLPQLPAKRRVADETGPCWTPRR